MQPGVFLPSDRLRPSDLGVSPISETLTMMSTLIFFPYLAPCLTYRVIDTLLPRDPPVGIYAFMRLRYLLLIHKGLPYPEVCNIMPYHLLRRLMSPHVFP